MTHTLAPLRGPVGVPRGGGGPALLAVAHGSRDPRSAATMAAVVAEVAAARPDLTVRLAFLDLSAPSVEQVADDLAAQGQREVIVVPLLLGNAFHARVDLPALLAEVTRRHPRLRLTQADVLGPDPLLVAALGDRVAAADRAAGYVESPRASATPHLAHPGSTDATPEFGGGIERTLARAGRTRGHGALDARPGVAVAAVGSSDPAANRRTAAVARRLAALTGLRTEICFATVEPGITVAIERLRARGAERIVVAPWFLAPGLLTDRLLAAAPELPHAEVIGVHAGLTEVIWTRFDSAVAADLELSA
ncbi:CbiX/SirB N-terminal domain-containing protein [Nocardia sp. AG03]|uniref:sirohydrochlorin chelatase n=1 Tax=Nocardia sp. AG03 TaxID=3025312 RepID=UPI0024187DD8|nr:CbiX/SirB N-terminal domain-containing protein [Nocardia sp. AG03]